MIWLGNQWNLYQISRPAVTKTFESRTSEYLIYLMTRCLVVSFFLSPYPMPVFTGPLPLLMCCWFCLVPIPSERRATACYVLVVLTLEKETVVPIRIRRILFHSLRVRRRSTFPRNAYSPSGTPALECITETNCFARCDITLLVKFTPSTYDSGQ